MHNRKHSCEIRHGFTEEGAREVLDVNGDVVMLTDDVVQYGYFTCYVKGTGYSEYRYRYR
jgi:hypothetical protein